MENSDSSDEGEESEAHNRSQMDQKVQGEDLCQFVNNQSEDDYKLMRDNNLLGNPGDSLEELWRRLQLIKESLLVNSDENTDEGDSSDDVSSNDSLIDWLMSFEPSENVTSRQREQPSRGEVSQLNPPSDFRFSSEINFNLNNGSPDIRKEHTPSTRLPRRGYMKHSQSQVKNPQPQSRFTRQPRSEQSRIEALMEIPPTRGQKRERRSPDHSRTKARLESMSLPCSLGLLSQRPHHGQSSWKGGSVTDQLHSSKQTKNVTSEQREYQLGRDVNQFDLHSDFRFSSEINFNLHTGGLNAGEEYTPSTRLPRGESMKNSRSQVKNPQSESRFTSRTGILMEVPPVRGQQSISQDHSRTRASTGSKSSAESLGELLQRLCQSISSLTFEQPLVYETEGVSGIQHYEILRQQIAGPELQKRVFSVNSETKNAIQGQSSPDTASKGESCQLRQMNPTASLHYETGQVHPEAYLEKESVTSRTQITSKTPNHTITLEREYRELRHMFSYYEQADMRAYVSTIRIPIHRTLHTGLNNTTSGAIPSTLRMTMIDFNDSSSLMDRDSDSGLGLSASSQNMERAESPNRNYRSHGSRSLGSNSISSCDYCFHSAQISSLDSSYMSPSSSSLMSNSSSSDENSEAHILLFESRNEGLSPHSSSESTSDSSRSMTPIIFYEGDSWPSLENHPTGLSKTQIDKLDIRSFVKNDTLNMCIICTSEYTEGSQLRILPCCHEFHVHCIDRWLYDNSTCPICRGKVVDSSETENSN